jgi:GTPase SAR1 family protein
MNILILGPSQSGKTTLGRRLAREMDATFVSEEDIRQEFGDWDADPAGVWRLGLRFNLLKKEDVVTVFESSVLPGNYTPDKIVFMDTYENSMEVPKGSLVVSASEWWREPWISYWARTLSYK